MHVLGKALTGGYLPLAITLVAEAIFWNSVIFEARKQLFFMVPSYTGNALACAAANASLELFEMENAEKADGNLLQ